MNIAVVAIAKNEELYIEEWFNAYRKIGVNHFYIFDNNDEGNTALAELVKRNQYTDVSLIDVRGPEKLKKYGYQFGCYKMAYDQLSKDYDYMGFFDIDEFLYLNDKTIPDWLAEHKEFDYTDVIKFNWLYYGDNGLVHYDNRPVQKRFKEPCPINTKYAQNFPESLHIKCLLKCGKKMLSGNCHTFVLEGGKAKSANGKDTVMNSPFVNPPSYENGFIKHYGTKTIEEYIDRKCRNVKDATGGSVSIDNRIKWFFNVNEDTLEKRNMIDNKLNKKYAVITYIFGKNKERLRKPLVIDTDIDYICVTDQSDIKSDVWKIVIDTMPEISSNRDKMALVKYNPFKYTNAEKILVIDGSFEIKQSIKQLFEHFVYDIGLKLHPRRNYLGEELPVWKQCRNLPETTIQKFKIMARKDNLDLNKIKLYESSLILYNNNELNKDICDVVLKYMKILGEDGNFIITNQCPLSYVMRKHFNEVKIQHIDRNDFFNRYIHNTKTKINERR